MNEEQLAKQLKALSDVNRIQILALLVQKERCACELLAFFHFSQPTLSHHMKVLIAGDLVRSRKVGTWNYYRINQEKATTLLSQLNQLLSPCSPKRKDG